MISHIDRSARIIFTVILMMLMFCGLAYAQFDVNLITNPGFESGIEQWPQNPIYWNVDNEVSHTGTSSLKLTNTDPAVYSIVKRQVPVNINSKYQISAWIKTENVTGDDSGASIALLFYDADGIYISGYYPQGIKGTNNWKLITTVCTSIPKNASTAVYFLYLRKGCTGTAWFDDVSVIMSSDVRLNVLITNPHYRNTLFADQPKYISVGASVETFDMYPINELYIEIAIKSGINELMSASMLPDSIEKIFPDLEMNLENLNEGVYTVSARLIDRRTSDVLAIKELPLEIKSLDTAKPEVYIDSQNRCIVDGKPFLPLGLYCSGSINDVSGYIDRISTSRFNCLMNYSTPYYLLDDIKLLLDTANSKSIKMIFSIKDCYDGHIWELSKAGPWEGSFNVIKGMVSTFKDHPAILGWYLNDELSAAYVNQINERYQYIREYDSDHPIWQVLYYKQDLSLHVDSTDVLGVVNYPVMENCQSPLLYKYGEALEDASKIVMHSRGIWAIGECSTIRYDGINPTNRPPTYDEIMCETYQGLVNGARGLFFFNLSDLLRYDGESQWEIMKEVGEHLYSIQPFILGTDAVSEKPDVSDARVSVLARYVDNDLYIIAVNPYNETINVEVTLKNFIKVKEIHELSGNTIRIIKHKKGQFADSIEQLGTRIYKVIKVNNK